MSEQARAILAKAVPNGECLEYHNSMSRPNGYPRVGPMRANRFIYSHLIGSIPEGLFVLHSCDNRVCINPKHLFLGTQHDNVMDMWNKGRKQHVPPSSSKPRVISEEQRLEILKLRETGMTYEAIGAKYGVTKQTIYQYIRGKR